MLVLRDRHVVLDLLLDRDPWKVEAAKIGNANRDGRLEALISAASVLTIFSITHPNG